MKNEITVEQEKTIQPAVPDVGTPNFNNINQGTVAIESMRAIAEARSKLEMAKAYPRNETVAYAKIMEACHRKGLAEKAFYSYPRGKEVVSGPTIRFAEELGRCWGNLDYGIKELSQDNGKSEMQAYCWDLETNTMSVQNFTNPHKKETKSGIVTLTSLRDIYEINANMAARRLRARILAILPADIVEDAIQECKATLAGKTDEPLSDRVRKMVTAFEKFGVKADLIEKRLKRKIDTMTVEDFTDYIGIYNSLKEGASKVSDWFDVEPEANELTAKLDEVIENDK